MTDSVRVPSPERLIITNLGERGIEVDTRPYIDRYILSEVGLELLTEAGDSLLSKDFTEYTRTVVED